MEPGLKKFLDDKVARYNNSAFIPSDPISIPHHFKKRQDIEIAGFFASIFAWGNRTTIINKSNELMCFMDHAPYDFCKNHMPQDLKRLLNFRHRTFNPTDLLYCINFFQMHYKKNHSLENAFTKGILSKDTVEPGLNNFYDYFFSLKDVPLRTRKHIASPAKKSACKRLNMFLRWMVRKDNAGVDFGIWKKIKPSQLIIPLDVHVGRVARNLKLLNRKQTDWMAALELTQNLKGMDAVDPVKYDFALFGLGTLEKF